VVVVVVDGASVVVDVDEGVLVSDAVDDGAVLAGTCVFVVSDGLGLSLVGAGAVVTLGAGVFGALPDV
jgi:hypothetical protein